MTDWIGAPLRTLNELEAFDAMVRFLEDYWERGGKRSDDLANLLSDVSREMWINGMPGDPAQWPDFRLAVGRVLESD